MKKSLIVELFIFAILTTMLVVVGTKVVKHTFDIGTTYHLAFKDIDGIVIGSPVRILGVDIGHVTKIQSNFDEIYIDFVVTHDKVKIPQGTKATIEFFGLAGSRSIELTPPDSKTNAQGILIEAPIRIGDAFDIMAQFARAMMVSVGGLYEFAKNRTQREVEMTTAAFLNNTNNADDSIENLTNIIQQGGAKVHKSFEGTTKGMTRVYDEAQMLNVSRNINVAKYATNLTKRSLIKFHRKIKDFNKYSEISTNNVNYACKKIEGIGEKVKQLDGLHNAFVNLDSALCTLDKNLSQENLDKVYDSMDYVRILSENLKDKI